MSGSSLGKKHLVNTRKDQAEEAGSAGSGTEEAGGASSGTQEAGGAGSGAQEAGGAGSGAQEAGGAGSAEEDVLRCLLKVLIICDTILESNKFKV